MQFLLYFSSYFAYDITIIIKLEIRYEPVAKTEATIVKNDGRPVIRLKNHLFYYLSMLIIFKYVYNYFRLILKIFFDCIMTTINPKPIDMLINTV